ncbi:MAG: hypothetical protein NTY06_00535 [Candidatus Gottesmanbacteria bacterium]|nr:hypothetical protein [Candidatus Gottesmanbacteria bacterium]
MNEFICVLAPHPKQFSGVLSIYYKGVLLSARQREQDLLGGVIIGVGLSILSSVFFAMYDRLSVQKWDQMNQLELMALVGVFLIILVLYCTLRLMSLSKIVNPKKETKEEVKMSDKEEHKTDFQRDLELTKIQIFADVAHNAFNNQVTMWSGVFFTILAIIYTLYSAKLLPIEFLLPSVLFFGFIWGFQVRSYSKKYNENLMKVNTNLQSIQEKKQLPSLEELLKLDKEKKTTISEN